ncbi:MAG: hypothetical protein SOX16_03365, partial [Megasphaera elsdenii]|nr:hypothetical protein [Megasphaera elsdenii]
MGRPLIGYFFICTWAKGASHVSTSTLVLDDILKKSGSAGIRFFHADYLIHVGISTPPALSFVSPVF